MPRRPPSQIGRLRDPGRARESIRSTTPVASTVGTSSGSGSGSTVRSVAAGSSVGHDAPSIRSFELRRLFLQDLHELVERLREARDPLVLERAGDVRQVDAQFAEMSEGLRGGSAAVVSTVRATVPWSKNASTVASGIVLTVSRAR